MLGAMTAAFTDHNTIYWLIYEVMLIVFFILFVWIYHIGRKEYRPYTHQRFEQLRIACVVSLLFNIIWTLQFVFKHTKIVSLIFGFLSDTMFALIICSISAHIISNYFSLKSEHTPRFYGYFLYSWCLMTFLTIIGQLLSYSLDTTFVNDLYLYCIYVDTAFNISFFVLLMIFITLFASWILRHYHRINWMKHTDSPKWAGSESDVSTGGENDATAQRFLLRLIVLLCGFGTYFGLILASNMYAIHISHTDKYGPYHILVHFVCEKLILFLSFLMYLLPRPDNYLSVNPNILNSLNITLNIDSNRQKKSTFKDPNASDKWDYHAGHSVDTSYRDDSGLIDYSKDETWDNESNVSYTTLMFRKEQQQKQILAARTPRAQHWLSGLSFFSPSSGFHSKDKSDDRLISVPTKKSKAKKSSRIKKQRFLSQAQQIGDSVDEESQSIRSMVSNET